MPNHFGRFRVLNDTPENADGRMVKKATFKIGTPPILYTVVGFGTQFPEVPPQYFAEYSLEAGMAYADEIEVDVEIYEPANPLNVETVTATLKVADAILLQSVDINILYRASAPHYRARSTTTGANYTFKEQTDNF